jgi:hypothetical protein
MPREGAGIVEKRAILRSSPRTRGPGFDTIRSGADSFAPSMEVAASLPDSAGNLLIFARDRVRAFALRHAHISVVPVVEPGPIPPGRLRPSSTGCGSQSRGHGVWVPAFAGTTAWRGFRSPTERETTCRSAFAGTNGEGAPAGLIGSRVLLIRSARQPPPAWGRVSRTSRRR